MEYKTLSKEDKIYNLKLQIQQTTQKIQNLQTLLNNLNKKLEKIQQSPSQANSNS